MLYLWEWFWDMRSAQPPGFSGVVPISNSEMVAWLQLTGNIVRREEASILRAMDNRYIDGVAEEEAAIKKREDEEQETRSKSKRR